jgi:hypothetical protein
MRPASPTRLEEDSTGGESQGSPVTPSETYYPLLSLPPNLLPSPVSAGFRRYGLLLSGIPPAQAARRALLGLVHAGCHVEGKPENASSLLIGFCQLRYNFNEG